MHRLLIPLVIPLVVLGSADALAQRSRRFDGPWFPDPTQKRLPILHTNVHGWALEGSGYEFKCDGAVFGCALPVLRSKLAAQPGTGALVHHEGAAPWRGVTVEAQGELQAGRVRGQAVLIIRALDGAGNTIAVASSPPMTGTTPFVRHRISLEVPAQAERLTVGVELTGTGAVFVRELQFDDAELLDDGV